MYNQLKQPARGKYVLPCMTAYSIRRVTPLVVAVGCGTVGFIGPWFGEKPQQKYLGIMNMKSNEVQSTGELHSGDRPRQTQGPARVAPTKIQTMYRYMISKDRKHCLSRSFAGMPPINRCNWYALGGEARRRFCFHSISLRRSHSVARWMLLPPNTVHRPDPLNIQVSHDPICGLSIFSRQQCKQAFWFCHGRGSLR